MNNELVSTWNKAQAASQEQERERYYADFLFAFMGAEFWIEYEGKDNNKIALRITAMHDDPDERMALLYVGEKKGVPPEIIQEAMQSGDFTFQPFDGVFLLGIAKEGDCSLVMTSDGKDIACIEKEKIAILYNIFTREEQVPKERNKKDISEGWFAIGVVIVFILTIAAVGYYMNSVSNETPERYKNVEWKMNEIKYHHGDFLFSIPRSFQEGVLYRGFFYYGFFGYDSQVYTDNESYFLNHEINIDFFPAYNVMLPNANMVDILVNQMLIQLKQNVNDIYIRKRGNVQINGKNFTRVNALLTIRGRKVLLTFVVVKSDKGIFFLKVASVDSSVKEHEFFANKIFNTIKVN